MLYVMYVIYDIYNIYDILHVWCYDKHHMYVCQYRCQKKRQDLRNAANHLIYPNKFCLGPKPEISCILIFLLYFQNFLCIICDSWGSNKTQPGDLKFLVVSHIRP